MRERPRIACRAKVRGLADTHGELVQIGFAEDDGTCSREPGDNRRVLRGNSILEDRTAGGRAYAGGVDVVFEGDWNAVEWATPFSGLELGVERARLRERPLF